MSAKNQLSSLRSRLRVDKEEATRSASAYAGAGVLGLMKAGGQMDRIPDVFGLPKTVSVALAAKIGANYMSGTTANVLNGVGDAAAVVAIYEFAQGVAVSGVSDRASDLERRLASRLSEDELADLEDELAAHGG
jgi:hypothetical protein